MLLKTVSFVKDLSLTGHLCMIGYFRENPEQFNCSDQRFPRCFQSCLRELEVHNFDGFESEVNLMKYLLMNVQVLEKMTIKVTDYIRFCKQEKMGELRLEIDMMPRCSKHFELVFI